LLQLLFLAVVWTARVPGSSADAHAAVNYVVQFHGFRPRSELTLRVQAVARRLPSRLGSQRAAVVVVAVGAHHELTDIVTVACADAAVAQELEAADSGIKRVFPNAWISQKLLQHWAPHTPAGVRNQTGPELGHITRFPPLPNRGGSNGGRQLLMRGGSGHALQADHRLFSVWASGARGSGVRIAVLDSGLDCRDVKARSRFRHLGTCTDWTTEGTTADAVGHGTFVAGILASATPSCGGVAPEAELHVRLRCARANASARPLAAWHSVSLPRHRKYGLRDSPIDVNGKSFRRDERVIRVPAVAEEVTN
jgi:subtilisin family serine protease